MFVVLTLQDFKFEPVNFSFPISIVKDKMMGYLPVYATKEDALADFPDREVLEIKEVG